MSERLADVVMLSTADWANPLWTNKQHVAVCLAERGHRVFYIDSLGLRRPSANGRDLGRVAQRLRGLGRGPRRVRPSIWVWSPALAPWHHRRSIRAVNRWLLGAQLRRILHRLEFESPWLWTYNPLTTELLDCREFSALIYHCVDDISAQPDMPRELIQRCEKKLVSESDIVFTTSTTLQRKCEPLNANTHYLSNVADFDHFKQARDPETQVPSDLDAIPSPRLGFIGAVSAYKLDFELLKSIAESRPDWSLVLIGNIGEGEPETDVRSIRDTVNIHLLGRRDYSDLPAYLKGFDVALLPSRINDYTRSMFPMKFFEYLAAGKPVVSTKLPTLEEYSDTAELGDCAAAFIKAVAHFVDHDDSHAADHRQSIARRHTYAIRTERMIALIQNA